MRPCPFRGEAFRLGLPTYSNGNPCKRGHKSTRVTANGTCTVCNLAISAKARSRRLDKIKVTNAAYYEANREAVSLINAAWREAHPAELKAIRKAHYMANRERYQESAVRRKRVMRHQTPAWADLDAIRLIYAECSRVSKKTGIRHDVDHVYPLRGRMVCGLHVEGNLRVIPAVTNRRKGNRIECGAVHDRDVNAARNILARSGLRAPAEGVRV